MAEQTNGNAVQKAAENALLQIVARWGIIAICGTALPAGAWVGTRLVSSLDEVVKSVGRLETDVAVMKNDIGYLKDKVKP